MSLAIQLLPEAKSEFDDATDWYELQKTGLGQSFIDAIHEVFHRISNTPKLHAVVYNDVRKAVVRRFPYNVFYRVETDRIAVIAVFHTSRDPKGWQSRI